MLTFIFYVLTAYNKYVPISRDVGNEATYKKVRLSTIDHISVINVRLLCDFSKTLALQLTTG